MIKKLQCILSLFVFVSAGNLIAQSISINEELNWKGLVQERNENIDFKYLYFENALLEAGDMLPQYTTSFPVNQRDSKINVQISNEQVEVFNAKEAVFLNLTGYSQSTFEFTTEVFLDRKKPIGVVKFVPIRFNPETATFEKLVSFQLTAESEEIHVKSFSDDRQYAANSVLSQGDWYKIAVKESGVHKLSYADLENMGLNVAAINPQHIRLYGNGGEMLPEKNIDDRIDDLMENSIFISGEDDGSFDQEDYILFYGMNPHKWTYHSNKFEYQVNYYDDRSFYYLTVSLGSGKRINTEPSSAETPTFISGQYNDYQMLEEELVNLIYSGKSWYGDLFGSVNSKTYDFNFPNKIPDEEVLIKIELASKNTIIEDLVIKVNGIVADSLRLTATNPGSYIYAKKKTTTIEMEGLGSNIQVEIIFNPEEISSMAWLDFITINTISELKMLDGHLFFRDSNTIGFEAVTKFIIGNSNEFVKVWDVTDPLSPKHIETEYDAGETNITVGTNDLKEFVAFDGSNFKIPEFVEQVANQNLHATGPVDLVIVTPPIFKEQAHRLAVLHDSVDNMRILMVEPDEIYNEFSSGKQDPTAIRDFIKMLYDKYEGEDALRYLMLFGDGSFDPKDRIENNTNFVPAFQTSESLSTTSSYVVDDYYGLLDDTEGHDGWGMIDIGIGRIPVQTVEEAKTAVDKIYKYVTPGSAQFGKWRMKVCLIGDDQDGNLHLEQADSLKYYIPDTYNINKIYLDAFTQIATPSGEKYPDVTVRINDQVENGALIVNYVGHGGISGWAHERVTTMNDIKGWTNADHLPVFVTATCEFSRFDDPDIVSAGEEIYRNLAGGGIALLTTTRVAYSVSNFLLNLRLNSRAFIPGDDGMPRLGDLIRESKPPGQQSTRNFVLLGDPALRLAYPKYKIETTAFQGQNVDGFSSDTISSLQKVYVQGKITDEEGNRMNDFNGYIFPELYDKPLTYSTLGNDIESYPVDFKLQDQVLWHGQYEVTDGVFSFELIVPKDITFNYGKGKLSYYAYSEQHDAFGSYTDFTIGGIDENATVDNTGPEINLFINDYNFISGDITHSSPLLIAHIKDENGINLSSNGIGHEITLVLNNDHSDVVILNDLYVPDTNSYKSGSVRYPYYNLPDGTYTLNLKAWDSYNNSNEASIEFTINNDAQIELTEVKNVPNPFTHNTLFTFQHNKPGQELDVELQIFDINGKFILSYQTTVTSQNTTTSFLDWDGKDANGQKIPQGMYVYQLMVTDEGGNVAMTKQKLVISQ